MNKLVKTVKKADLYKTFLNSLNGILGLTNRELQLLEAMVNMELSSEEHKEWDNIVGTESRKYIHETTGIGYDNLSRYIAKFKSKGILVNDKYDKDRLNVNKALIPEIIGDRIQITVVIKIDKNEEV